MQSLLTASVALCLVLSLGHAASVIKPDLQREHCSWGSQYWCSSPEIANLCGKIEWCALNDWPYDVVQDSSCTAAQSVIKNTRTLILNAALKPVSEYDFAMFLARSCAFFKDDKEKRQCKDLVSNKDVLTKLVQLVDSKLSVKAVATAVGMCQKNIPIVQPCLRCPEMVSNVQKLISKFLTQDAYMKLIEPQCVKLGQGHQLCQVMGQAKYTDFYNALINAPTASVCKDMTQCLGVFSGLQSVQASTECEACKVVVKEIRELDQSPGVQTVLQNLIKSVCAKLGTFAQVCDLLADEGLEHLSELIATEMEPDVVCEELKLCGQPEQKTVQSSSAVGGDLECIACEMFVREMAHAIGSNITQEKLEKLITNDFCNRLPAPINSQCGDLVLQYSPRLIHVVLNDLDPQTICTILKLCKNATTFSHVKKQPNDEKCEICKYVVTYLDTFLTKNATEAEIEALLDKVCVVLPQAYIQECETLVKQYGPLIVQLLLAELQPAKVCLAIGLCSQQKLAFSQVKTQLKQPNDEVCDVCKYVVKYLDNWLDENSTQAEIEMVLDKVCQILPANWSQQCESIVQAYGPLIIQMLIGELQPIQVCQLLKMCPASKQGALPHVAAPVLKLASSVVPVGKQKTELCALCESLTFTLETLLKENATQAEIISTLDKVCGLLPEKDKAPCVQLLPLYTGYVIDLINQELPPKLVCKIIKICVDDEVNGPRSKTPSCSLKKGELCPLCMIVIEEVFNILEQNRTETEIVAAFDKVCNVLPATIKDECIHFVALYLPYVVDLIVQELTPNEICQKLGLCNASIGQAVKLTQSLQVSKETAVKAGELCPLCIYVLEVLDELLAENSTEIELEAALDKVCNYLPSFKGQCESFVALYTPFAIDFFTKKLTPAQICNELGLCTNGTVANLHIPTNLRKLSAGPQCVLCEYVVKYLDNLLSQNATEQEIEQALDKVCDMMPSVKTECEDFVKTYAPQLLVLLKTLSPEQVCSTLGLCSSQVKANLHIPTNLRKLFAGPQCVLCEYVVKYLDNLLNQNATEQEIEQALDKVCDMMPSVKTECEDFVKTYAPQLLVLLKTLSPEQVCSTLGLCSNQVKAKPHIPADDKKLTSGPQCVLCEYVVKYLDTVLTKNATVAEIEAALDQVCSIAPSAWKSECVAFVTQYTPVLLELLKTLPPDQVCSNLKLCSSQVKAKHHIPTDDKKLTSGPQCVLCEYVVNYLDTVLTKNATVAEIEAALDQVCSIAPSAWKSECVAFVTQYTLVLLELLKTLPPDQVCSNLKLCSSQVKESTTTTTHAPYVEYCSACKFALYDIQTALRYPFWKRQSKAILSSMCSYLKTGQALCQHLVEDNYLYILDILDGFNFPMEFCQKIDFCEPPSKESQAPPKSLLFASESTTATTPAPYAQYCSACKFALYDIQTALRYPFWKQQSKAILSSTCSYLKTGQALCQHLVEDNYLYILDILDGFNFPMEFCQKIDFCEPPAQVERETRCSSCISVVKMLKSQARPVTSTEEMNALAEFTCRMASSHEAYQCKTVMKQHIPQLVELMAKYADPSSVCEAASLCKSPSVERLYKVLKP